MAYIKDAYHDYMTVTGNKVAAAILVLADEIGRLVRPIDEIGTNMVTEKAGSALDGIASGFTEIADAVRSLKQDE